MASILVVDDDGHIRQVVRYALERAGHQVREAKDGAEALREVAREPPDLLVLDILLPEEDGLQVCRQIRAASRLPIIFLSSRDDELDRVIGLERLRFLHLNDSKHPLGSRRDRHAGIGEGTLGKEPFRRIMQDERLRHVPKVIETPKGPEPDDEVTLDRANLALLRSFR